MTDPGPRPTTPPRVLAVIPARGGSRGLPGKNTRTLCGLPLVAHAIRAAAMTPCVTRTIVTTDSQEIADVARAHGGEVPFLRPASLAADDTPFFRIGSKIFRIEAGIEVEGIVQAGQRRSLDTVEAAELSGTRRAFVQ